MIGINFIRHLFQAFRDHENSGQVAHGVCIGYLIGLMPFMTLQGHVLFLVLFFARINIAGGTVAMVVAGMFAYLLDPVFHKLGYLLLVDIAPLQGIWESIYNMPIAPLSKFNNTVVLGSMVFGIVTYYPVYWAVNKFISTYSKKAQERIKKMKIAKMITGSRVYRWYEKISSVGV